MPDASQPGVEPGAVAGGLGPSPEALIRIVGIGASAGGLDALEKLFGDMPAGHDLAFVIVQHLDPHHASQLTGLIGRAAAMPVHEIRDGMIVEGGHVYVIPPGRSLSVSSNMLCLSSSGDPVRPVNPIDGFLRSLADQRGEAAIAIILSGTGTDGVQGIRAVKGLGGLVLVQRPATASHEGMPRAAISTGIVDLVLPPEEIGQQLLAVVRDPLSTARQAAATDRLSGQLERIFPLLRTHTGHDFSQYKRNPVLRRIQRRMAVVRAQDVEAYIDRLRKDREEGQALFRDLLIGVTSFFRDPAAFAVLRNKAVDKLVADAAPGGRLRIWVPACATGEEAYSIAILLDEAIERRGGDLRAQVFATDIDAAAVEVARSGIYPSGLSADIPGERLERFFSPVEHGHMVKPLIRDMIVFAEQDVVRDPPFSRLDLLSCRNLLIYFDTALQQRVIETFHYALNPGGFLFLGTADSLGDAEDRFLVVDRKEKLFSSAGARRMAPAFDYRPRLDSDAAPLRQGMHRPGLRAFAETFLLEDQVAVCVIVDRKGEVQYIHGNSGNYLAPPSGEASQRLEAMARPGLQASLSLAMRQAIAEQRDVEVADVQVESNAGVLPVNLKVRCLLEPAEVRGYLMVLLAPVAARDADPPRPVDQSRPEAELVARLQRELQEEHAYRRTIVRELETANEDLRSANEELQSANEELQSMNEEQETAKEELQSTNEELMTVNAELENRMADLDSTRDDMANLLSSIDIGVIFLDMDLRITRFTPVAARVANIMSTDIGRPLSHIVFNLQDFDFVASAGRVLESLIPVESQLCSRDGASWYALRMQPYRSSSNMIAGVVLTFRDFTRVRALEEEARLAIVVRDSSDAVSVQHRDGRILAWNPRAHALYGYSEAEALALPATDLVPKAEQDRCRAMQERVLAGDRPPPFRAGRVAKNGQLFEVIATASALSDGTGVIYAMSMTERLIG